MNITDTSFVQYNTTTISNTTSTTGLNVTAVLTRTLESNPGDDWSKTLAMTHTNLPGARTWSLSTFLYVAVPLTLFTIVIPIAIGPFFRIMDRLHRTNSSVELFITLGIFTL
jgi:hypothetical protein